MILTTYMLADTIRNIQNEVRKKKKISSKRSKNGKIKDEKNNWEKKVKLVATLTLQPHTDMIY